jgi:UDP-N-acetyl-D-galactosamine dehydrogenase
MNERIAVVGLGYVGLPVALAFARHFDDTVGFDIDVPRIAELSAGLDRSGETQTGDLESTALRFTSDPADLSDRTFFVVAVPTPVDSSNRPDFSILESASRTVGRSLRPGAVVVFESTVYPGATEEICGPVLERESGLTAGTDFTLAYSPERINPGDRLHTLERITKVVSGQDEVTLERVAAAYERIIEAGVHRAPSIRVAEAAKVIENTQRDLNVALMNEVALICDRLGIRTADVLAAAGTKWNFLRFTPGLVGGHCIGVDPYYLTARAEQLGYQPEVILAGRRINNRMGEHIATTLVRLLIGGDVRVKGARVGVLGITFKENVSDLRNSRVPDIIRSLSSFAVETLAHDPLASPEDARQEYGVDLVPMEEMRDLEAIILAVPHAAYMATPVADLTARLRPGGILMDVKSVLEPADVSSGVRYWSL